MLLTQDFFYKNTKGLSVDVDMTFRDMLNIGCKVQLSFWLASGNRPIINRTTGEQVKLEESVKPNTEYYEKKDVKFFMAYSKLGLGKLSIGSYRLHKYKIRINAIRLDNGQVLGNPNEIFFELLDSGSKL